MLNSLERSRRLLSQQTARRYIARGLHEVCLIRQVKFCMLYQLNESSNIRIRVACWISDYSHLPRTLIVFLPAGTQEIYGNPFS